MSANDDVEIIGGSGASLPSEGEVGEGDPFSSMESMELEVSNTPDNKLSKNRRSRIYNYFDYDEKTTKWTCKCCRKRLANPKGGGTGSLTNHLKNLHRNKYNEFKALTNAGQQTSMLNYGAYTITLPRLEPVEPMDVFDEEAFHKKLVKFIVTSDQPFSLVDEDSFRDVISYASSGNEQVKIPCRQTLRELIKEEYVKTLEDFKTVLKANNSCVSTCIDGWTSSNGHAFLGVFGHWITEDWEPRNVMLDITLLHGSHTGANLSQAFGTVLTNYDLWGKLLAVTTDNAANMIKFAKKLEALSEQNGGNFKSEDHHLRCMAHIINLSCQAAIKSLNVKYDPDDIDDDDIYTDDSGSLAQEDDAETSFVGKIRRASVFIRNSPKQRERFLRMCEVEGLKPKNPILDVRVRWNSTYLMLKRAFELKTAFDATVGSKSFAISLEDWNRVELLVSFLAPFYDATTTLSESGVPKLSRTVCTYNALFDHLENYLVAQDTSYRTRRQQRLNQNTYPEWLQKAAESARDKLTEYYPTSDGVVHIIGTILDPRYKLEWYNTVKWRKEWITNARAAIKKVWKDKYKPTEDECQEVQEPAMSPFLEAMNKNLRKRKDEGFDELGRYFVEQTETVDAIEQLSKENNGKDGVFCWWKNNRSRFPNLSRMARDYLAASATGVPVERLFSAVTDLLSPRRQRASPDTIQQCMSLKCWFKTNIMEDLAERVVDKALGE